MPTPKTGSTATKAVDAIELLTADHKEVKALFKAYGQLVDADGDDEEKLQLALDICTKLTVHANVEEELFYPAAREALENADEDEDLLDEAEVEHACAKDLIAQIVESGPADPLYDAKVKVLGEYIDHHVEEEEGELFPKIKKTDLDVDTLGEEIANRKEELLAEMADADVE